MIYKVDLELLEKQINLCDKMNCELSDKDEADMFDGLATFLSVILDEIKKNNPIEFEAVTEK